MHVTYNNYSPMTFFTPTFGKMLTFVMFIFVCALPGFTLAAVGRISQGNVPAMSTEEKFKSLDNAFATSLSERMLEQNSKLHAIDRELNQLEAIISMQFDKIAENMSNGHFKNDIARDHLIRKIDSTYERINHRLVYLEMKAEMGEKNILNKLDLLYSRFEKMEETLTTREGDIEMEIADVIAVAEEIRSNCLKCKNIDITEELNNTMEETVKTNFKILRTKLEDDMKSIEGRIVANINETSVQIFTANEDLKASLNENINKVVDLYENSMKSHDILYEDIKSISAVINTTRIEQQNGLRSLIVQVGRLGGKNNVLSTSAAENEQLQSLGEKLDANFENIMVLQNLFLESCHRIQMDEAQIESKISEVLEKLIDTFERKTSIELKDLQSLEVLIKNHDSIIRRNLHTNSVNLGTLVQKGKENKDAIKADILGIKTQIQMLFDTLDELRKNTGIDYSQIIMECLKRLESETKITSQKADRSAALETVTQTLIDELWKNMQKFAANYTDSNKLQISHIHNIEETLKGISAKLGTMNLPDEEILKHIDDVLEKYIEKYKNASIDNAISAVFGKNRDNKTKVEIDFNQVDSVKNCTKYDIDVRSGAKVCINNTIDAEIQFQDPIIINCTDFEIDVRTGFKKCTNADFDQTNDTKIIYPQVNKFDGIKNQNCTDFEIDIRSGFKKCKNDTINIVETEDICTELDIDVRSQNGKKKCKNSTEIIFKTEENVLNCTDIDIDVRSKNGKSLCKPIDQNIVFEDTPNINDDANCTDFDIDVRNQSGKKICKPQVEKHNEEQDVIHFV